MKKVLVVLIVALAMLSCSVTVFAADKGLNATYYQNKGIEEGNKESAILGNLGSNSPTGNFEANKEALFESLQEMGTIVVDTFEVEQNDEDWRAQAEDAGCVMIGDRNEADAPDWFVVKYTGYVVPNETAEYTFGSYYLDNGLVIYIDNQLVFEFWGNDLWIDTGADDKYAESAAPVSLDAGKAYPIEVYYYDGWGGEWVEFEYGMGFSEMEFYVEEPTAEDIAEQMATPEPTTPKPATPTPTKAPVPTKAPTQAPNNSNTGDASTGDAEPAGFPWVIVGIVGAVVVAAVVVVVIVASKKKKA